ncbi:MAG: hypothetical protein OEV65_14700 [Aquincola sp.]|nr:hypothetical protein [Aquincola sp.]MDH5210430.1 hypothetical protein [Betaproteobacteria bacterium]
MRWIERTESNMDARIDAARMRESDRLAAKAHMRDAEAVAAFLAVAVRKLRVTARSLAALCWQRAS